MPHTGSLLYLLTIVCHFPPVGYFNATSEQMAGDNRQFSAKEGPHILNVEDMTSRSEL